MERSSLSRLIAGAAAAALAATAVALGVPAHAATAQSFLSYADGWRVDRHPRVLADVNGDERADAVGFGDAGVWVALGQAGGTFAAPALKVRGFGWDQGWRVGVHPRAVADLDGDGRDDVVGFGDAGVWVSYAQPDGSFTAPALKLRDLGRAQGWTEERHSRQVADLDGDGLADLVGFGDAGVHVSHATVLRGFTGTGRRIDDFGYAQGWRVDRHPRVLADMDADGTADVVGFGNAGTRVSYFSASGDTFAPSILEVADFGWNQGWRLDRHVRVVDGDASGDGRADVIGFGERGVLAAHSRPYAQGEPKFFGVSLELAEFGYAQGWRVELHPRTLADINGDRLQDAVGFGWSGVHVSYGDDNAFVGTERRLAEFGTVDGWRPDRYPRLLGDVNGDGRDDVVGFGHSATYVALS